MLILASKSPARIALLQGAGLRFEASPARIDERAIESELLGKPPEDVARRLAEAKALDVASRNPGAVVVGADQLLVLGSEQLHKPTDMAAARRQLERLRGRAHRLVAGIALVREGALVWSGAEAAELAMRRFSDAELEHVLALEGESVLDSVGAYRLEGPAVQLFERISGDYFTILGLPLLPLLAALRANAPDCLGGFT